jgi:hypothetical protein
MGTLVAGMRPGAGAFDDLGHYSLTGLKRDAHAHIKLYVAENLADALGLKFDGFAGSCQNSF